MEKSTGRAKSCTTCRQFKLACDARRTAPDPCSRCVSKNLKCRFDPNFKRISTRRITQQVADELHTLRAAQKTSDTRTPENSQPGIPVPSPSAQSVAHSVRSSAGSQEQQSSSSPKRSKWLSLSEKEVFLDQTLQAVVIPANVVLLAFKHFDQYYSPHTPFLQPVYSINSLATQHLLLFWTILLVSLERFEGYENLYEQLSLVYETLLAQVVHVSIQTIEVIHALLLLTLWPVPKLRNSYDPGWNYVGLAVQAAMSLNCHNPIPRDSVALTWRGLGDISAANLDPAIQSMTWLSCFQIGARLSAYLGLPVPICIPQHSKSLERAKKLATDLLSPDERLKIRMLEMRCIAEAQLETIEDPTSHYSMTQACDAQLDTVKSTAGEDWTADAELQYQSAKMYILGMTFTQDFPAEQEQQTQAIFYRQIILEKCLQAASSYISTMTELSNLTIGGRRHPIGALAFHPKHFYFTALIMAACAIFRFLMAYQSLTSDQQQYAVQHLMDAHKIFQSFPDSRDAMRAAIHIEIMVNIIRTPPSSDSLPGYDMAIKNRLGASMYHDAVFRSTQQRNRRIADGTSPPPSQWTSMNEAYPTRLPLAPEQKLPSPQSHAWSNSPGSSTMIAPDVTGWEVWDSYSNDFGVMNEPWLINDVEFNKVYMAQQQVLPAAVTSAGIYETAIFPSVPIA